MKTVMIVAGGTGGHVFPGIAVARELRHRGISVVWLGTKHGLDTQLVPQEGIPFYGIPMVGLRGKSLWRKLTTPLRLFKTILQSMWLMLKLKPNVVIGMGGYVTAPAGIAAWLLRKPLVIHEQNAIAGMSNRHLARLATTVLQAFPNTFPATKKAQTVGNPVRSAIAELPTPEQRLGQRSGKLQVLIVGGSLGAQAINEIMPQILAALPDQITVWHQTGKSTFDTANAEYQRLGLTAKVEPFIDDMAQAYAWADIVICRAGALTVSELAVAGVASILVPLPIAVDDHQTANAKWLANAGAAMLMPQRELTPEALTQVLLNFYQNRSQLLTMAQAAKHVAVLDAVTRVADTISAQFK